METITSSALEAASKELSAQVVKPLLMVQLAQHAPPASSALLALLPLTAPPVTSQLAPSNHAVLAHLVKSQLVAPTLIMQVMVNGPLLVKLLSSTAHQATTATMVSKQSALLVKFAHKVLNLIPLPHLVLSAMKLVFSTRSNAHQDTIAQTLQQERKLLQEHTQPKALMGHPPLTAMMVTLVPLEQLVHSLMFVLMEPTMSLVSIVPHAQRVPLAATATKVNKLLVSLVCTVILQLRLLSTSSALLVPSQWLVLHLLPALSALVVTHVTSPVLR